MTEEVASVVEERYGTEILASMVSKISRIYPRFKETLGVRRTRKRGDLDLHAGTSFVTTGKLAGSSGENITREGRGWVHHRSKS